MSIPVDLDALADEMAPRAFCYLLTVSDDARPHAVAVQPALTDGVVSVEAGRRTCANAGARPNVSLVFPPTNTDGYSLIVDGDATVDGSTVRITPTRGVLHRPAHAPTGSSDGPVEGSCGSDCVELST